MNQHTTIQPDAAELDALVSQVEQLSDPLARRTLQQILEGVLAFHEAGLVRLFEMIAQRGAPGLLDQIAGDDLVSGLLSLYDLHPLNLSLRVERALDQVRPYLKSHGGEVELLAVENGIVRLRMNGSCHGCPSSAATLKGTIETSILSRVPEIVGIEVEGMETQPEPVPASGFVPLASLSASNGHGNPMERRM